jgi:hypothetical protein
LNFDQIVILKATSFLNGHKKDTRMTSKTTQNKKSHSPQDNVVPQKGQAKLTKLIIPREWGAT